MSVYLQIPILYKLPNPEVTMKDIVTLLLFCSFIFIVTAQAQRPITFDDLIEMQRIGDPQISPDGKTIAFVITTFDKNQNSSNSNIYVIPANGGEIRQLTTAKRGNFNPRWSPDGKTIAFISNRDGSPQIYTIPMDGGEANKVTNVSTGVNGLQWSPDGTRFAYWSEIYPDCPDDDCNRKRMEEKDQSKVQAMLFEGLPYRIWDKWKFETRYNVFTIPVDGGDPVNLTPGDFDSPPISLGGYWTYAFSPDGEELVFLRNTDEMIAISTNNDVFTVSIAGGEPHRLTTNPGNDSQPAYSPDGNYISYKMMERAGFEADRNQLLIYDRKNGTVINLTESFDYSLNDYIWSPDSRYIYFTADNKGNSSIFRVAIRDKKIDTIIETGYNHTIRIAPDGQSLVFLKESVDQPSELHTISVDGKNLSKITGINDERIATLDMHPWEDFWFDGAVGTRVHGFIIKPPGFNSANKYPIVMLAHGGPQGQWGDQFHYRWNAQMFASRGYVVVMINRRGSTGYGQRFTDEISGDWGGKAYKDLMKGLDYVIETKEYTDSSRVCAAGASYGGYMINWIAGQTGRFSCLVSHAGLFNVFSMYGTTEELWFPEWEFKGTPYANPELYHTWSPLAHAQNYKTPTLVIHGYYDFRVDVSEGFQMFTALQRQGVDSKFLYFPDEGHWINKPLNAELWYNTVLDWIDRYLKK
jgi:dipeptidyl aminopeptidase/acylaminoacyl peptidase